MHMKIVNERKTVIDGIQNNQRRVHVHMQAIPALYCYKYGKYDVWEEYRRHCTLNAMLQ